MSAPNWGRTLFSIAVLAGLNWNHAYAPPIGPAQRHAATHAAAQLTAPYARQYRISVTLATEVLRAADAAGIPRDIAFRMVKAESWFDSLAVSVTGALGLTQVLPSTGREVCPGSDLLRVASNLACGFKYLKMMQLRYDDWYVATAAYNLGPGVADTSRTLADLVYSQSIAWNY